MAVVKDLPFGLWFLGHGVSLSRCPMNDRAEALGCRLDSDWYWIVHRIWWRGGADRWHGPWPRAQGLRIEHGFGRCSGKGCEDTRTLIGVDRLAMAGCWLSRKDKRGANNRGRGERTVYVNST